MIEPTPSDLEAFIDERLAAMALRPRIWGSPEALECEGFLLVELYEKFCRDGPPRAIEPSGDLFIKFAKKHLPRRPSPMLLSQWFTDPQWGSPEVKDIPEGERQHWAGTRIVAFFIAWKAHLKGQP